MPICLFKMHEIHICTYCTLYILCKEYDHDKSFANRFTGPINTTELELYDTFLIIYT